MISLAWFIIGFTFGVCAAFGATIFLGNREIRKRKERSSNWQKVKKDVDQEIMDEYGI